MLVQGYKLIPSDRYELRDYQKQTIDRIVELHEGGTNRVLVCATMGLGKTTIAAFLPHYFRDHAARGVLFLVHRQELVRQTAERFREVWRSLRVDIEMGMDKGDPVFSDIVIASVQSLGQRDMYRLKRYQDAFGIIIVDEAHHCKVGGQYERILNFFKLGATNNDGSRLLVGITATPNRADGCGLNRFFDDVAADYNLEWAVKQGWLVDVKGTRIQTGVDIDNISLKGDDFDDDELSAALDTHERNSVIVRAWVEHGRGQGIAFCTNIQHAVDLAEEFTEQGINAAAIHSSNRDNDLEPHERRELIEEFRAGRIDLLTNVGIFTEGTDMPFLQTIMMCRPTLSQSLFMQMIGRGLRGNPPPFQKTQGERLAHIAASYKPVMTLIEFTDNTSRHQVVTVPRLFGLDPTFDAQEKTIREVLEEIDEYERVMPEKPYRLAHTLDEVRYLAQEISIWDAPIASRSIKAISNNAWVQEVDNFRLITPDNGVVRLKMDPLGRYRAEMLMPDRDPVVSNVAHASWKEAIAYYDKWLRHKYPDHTEFLWHRDALKKAMKAERVLLNKAMVSHDLERGWRIGRTALMCKRAFDGRGLGDVDTMSALMLRKKWLASVAEKRGASLH